MPSKTGDIIISPVWGNVPYPVTQAMVYGYNPSGYLYTGDFGLRPGTHGGLDIGMPLGTNLSSASSGKVSGTRVDGYGTHVINVTTEQGYVLIYQHLASIVVGLGDTLRAGQFIGIIGNANGPHLHFELRVPDESTQSGFRLIEPTEYLKAPGVVPDVDSGTSAGLPSGMATPVDFAPIGRRLFLFVIAIALIGYVLWQISK